MPIYTLFFAAAAALVNLWLAVRIGRLRTTQKISHGDGGNPLLARRMRAHLNFAESAPVVLILFLALELSGARPLILVISAVVFILARIAHGIGMDAPTAGPARGAGIGGSMLVTLFLAGYALLQGYNLLQNAPADDSVIMVQEESITHP